MLILPALAWLILPRPSHFALPPRASVEVPAAPAPSAEASASRPARTVRPVRPGPVEEGPVTGTVLDPDGHPAKQATVACEGHDPPLSATTDDEGRFQLGTEAAGCMAAAKHPEFIASERVPLAAGRSNTLRLSRGGGLEGDVVDEHGAPIAIYLIAVESYQGTVEGVPAGQVKTIQDPRGAFSWDRLPPGRYVLTASASGRPPVRSRQVEVEVGRTTAHVRITLPRGATMNGRVVDAATRKPIADAMVALDAYTGTGANSVRPARSDANGAYALDGAPAGPFSVRVTAPGYRSRIVPGLTTRGASTLQQDIELNPLVDGGPSGDDFAGIGAFLGPSPNGVTFVRLVTDGPAEKAGVRAGDLVRRIDGVDASSLSVTECMQSLRGPDGSRVSVQVERGGQRLDITIQRRALTL
jgi:hypothetical protein